MNTLTNFFNLTNWLFIWPTMMDFKKKLLFLIIIFLVLSGTIYGQEQGFSPDKIKQIKQYKSTQLENGLTIIQLNSEDTNYCFIRSYTNIPEYVSKNYRVALEAENEIRKMLKFKIPDNWSVSGLKSLGIKLDKDINGYFATCENKTLDTVLYLFNDLFQKSATDSKQIEESKQNILSKSDSLEKLPTDKIDRITKSIIYGQDHPILKHFVPAEVNPFNIQNYLEFYEKFFKPNNSYLVVIGNISIDSIKTMASKSLGAWKKKDVPSSDYKLIPIEEPKIVFFDTVPSGQTEIKILFPFALYPFTFDSEKAELLSVLFQDVLSEKLIKNQKLAKNIRAKFESDKITGNYQLQVELAKDSINMVVQSIVETISEFKAGKFPAEKLIVAKKQIIDEFKKNNTNNRFISALIVRTECNNLSKSFYADFIDEIEKTDNQGMKTFTAKYLNYNTALFQIPGHWYGSLNDFIKLSKDFRIELYDLNGSIKKIIPKGFNGFSVVDNYVMAVGGENNIKKIREVSIRYGAIYELQDDEQFFVEGVMIHKTDNKYYSESRMIRPKKDTLFLQQEIFNGSLGTDSTMQGKKKLTGNALDLLKYKSSFVPEMNYKEWQYKANLIKADTLDGNYVWLVGLENPAKQQILDFYDVDKGIRYKRIIKDEQYLNERVIHYSKYQRDKDDQILYPFLKVIYAPETTIRMRIREIDYDTRNDKKLFELN